jgi:hypothetical protein
MASKTPDRVSFPLCGTNIIADANDKLAINRKDFMKLTIIIYTNILSLCILQIYLDDTNNNKLRNGNKYIYKLLKIKRKYDLLSIKYNQLLRNI